MNDIGTPDKSSSDYESELREANEIVYKHSLELARLKKELEVANSQQENLLHFISHEIKGYLTKSEAAFAAISQGDFGDVPPALKSMTTAALEDVRKGVRTVIDILDASNLKRGTVAFDKKPFNFKDAVFEVVEQLRPSAEEKHLALSLVCEDGDYSFEGDVEKMKNHVIRNLVDNSIKYTQSGSVDVRLAREGGGITFTVSDTGVGITQDDMQRLFTEGGHGKDSIKVNVHSTGYGLFIAKQVVEAHGGTIAARSEGAGKGSQFIVKFPVPNGPGL